MPALFFQCTSAMILSYQRTARANMIMHSKMGIWITSIIAVGLREEQHLCAPDALYVVEMVKIMMPHEKKFECNNKTNISTDGGCATVRECAEEGFVSSNGVNSQICVCETERCNDQPTEDCECSDSAAPTLSVNTFFNLAKFLVMLMWSSTNSTFVVT